MPLFYIAIIPYLCKLVRTPLCHEKYVKHTTRHDDITS